MRYKINSPVAYTRKMKTKVFFRWFLYFLTLAVVYSVMSCGIFGISMPYFIISLAMAVSMREQEFSSSIYGIICGFMLDIATGTIFGFYAVWLMPCCFLASLFSRNLVKVNFVNHILFTAASTLFSFGMSFLFNYVIWNTADRSIIITEILIPSFFATVLTAPLVYFLIKFISGKFGLTNDPGFENALEEMEEKAQEQNNN